jgi:hypothetical protein
MAKSLACLVFVIASGILNSGCGVYMAFTQPDLPPFITPKLRRLTPASDGPRFDGL